MFLELYGTSAPRLIAHVGTDKGGDSMSDAGKTASGVTEHPLLLTTLVLYSIVLGLPLGKFPPIDRPLQSDLFILGVVWMLLVRMALTFHYGAVAGRYPGQLFVLEVAIAGLLAWQFRVLLDPRVDAAGGRLWLFYVLHLALVATMTLWSRILRSTFGVVSSFRVRALRRTGAVALVLGLILELPSIQTEYRMAGRWVVGGILLGLTIVYTLGKPWRQFETAAQPAAAPDGGHESTG